MRPEIPKNQNEFNTLMEEIDNLLKNRSIPIYNRPIRSFLEIAKKLKIVIPLVPIAGEAIPGVYDAESLSGHIHNWYQRIYGDRLNVQMGVGTGIILIRKDPWRVIFPMILGTVSFVCEKNIERFKDLPSLTANGTSPVINILNLIENISNDYANLLTTSELKEIKQVFLSGLRSISYLDMIKSKPFINEAKVDLENAVNNILSHQAHYGQSKWASLQFSEKLLKCFLSEKAVAFDKKRGHDLAYLRSLAVDHGLTQFPTDLVAQVQCSPGVRYGEEIVDLDEAVKAHYSSLGICFFSARGVIS